MDTEIILLHVSLASILTGFYRTVYLNCNFICLHSTVLIGWILIDRCGKHLPLILNFHRDGTVPLPQNEVELQEVLIDAKYYLIEQLVDLCEKALEKIKEEHDSICRVPLMLKFYANTT